MGKLIAGIVLEGMKTWNQERRLAFEKKHYKILKRVVDAENARYPIFNDAELALAKQEEELFLEAYYIEAQAHTKEVRNAESS
jgi:hypothetical protein